MATSKSDPIPTTSISPTSAKTLNDPAAPLFPMDESMRMMNWLARTDTDDLLSKAGVTRQALYVVRSDPEVRQCLETRADAVAAVPWRFEPSKSPVSMALIESLSPWWDRLVRGIFNAVPFGYSVVQLVLDSQQIPVRVLGCLEQPFEEFRITNGGEWRRYPTTGAGGAQGLPLNALDTIVTVRQPTGKYPYGDALLSALYWPVFFKREGLIAWLKFVERFGTPILLGKVMNPEAFVGAMSAAGFETAFGVQPGEEIQALLTSHGGELERQQEQLIRVIQRVILGQTLTSDVGGTGSYAAAKVHDLVREDKRNADVRLVHGSIQSWVDRLTLFLNQEPVQLVMADDTGLEQDRATRDATLQPVLRESKLALSRSYFMDRYDLRDSDLEDSEEPMQEVRVVPDKSPPEAKPELPPPPAKPMEDGE